jgi:hypothetical protein
MKIVNFIAPFARDECLRRLRTGVETSKSGVVGKVGDNDIRLRKSFPHDPHDNYNAFQTYLFGNLTDDGNQTRLQCRLGMHTDRFTFTFMVLWFGLVLFMWFSLLTGSGIVTTVNASGEEYIVEGSGRFVLPIFFSAFPAVLFIFAWYSARNEQKFMIDFLRKTIDVRPVE